MFICVCSSSLPYGSEPCWKTRVVLCVAFVFFESDSSLSTSPPPLLLLLFLSSSLSSSTQYLRTTLGDIINRIMESDADFEVHTLCVCVCVCLCVCVCVCVCVCGIVCEGESMIV